METVGHDTEHRAEATQNNAEAAQHDPKQPTEVSALIRSNLVQPVLNPVQACSLRASNLFQNGDAALHIRRITAAIGRLKRVRRLLLLFRLR